MLSKVSLKELLAPVDVVLARRELDAWRESL